MKADLNSTVITGESILQWKSSSLISKSNSDATFRTVSVGSCFSELSGNPRISIVFLTTLDSMLLILLYDSCNSSDRLFIFVFCSDIISLCCLSVFSRNSILSLMVLLKSLNSNISLSMLGMSLRAVEVDGVVVANCDGFCV